MKYSGKLLVIALLIAISGPVMAAREVLDLDSTCVISVLNRTVQANSDGEFDLSNVPSNQGQIRARANCVRDGKMVTGESQYFTVLNNDKIDAGIFYTGDDNIPVELKVSNKQPITINGQDQTVRLNVVARYANGNTKDVTASVMGINYQSSNPAIVAIDGNGLLVAKGAGRALITMRKDGVVAVASVVVVTSGDRDNDGIPDNVEVANGLNPDDPVDAFEDQDGDGLTAKEEFDLGTDIQNADTDGDGINDGEELIIGADGFVTNPLLADSDNDGLNDGLELTVNSDPTDANDANYGALITSIKAEPGSAVLFYNTIDTESSLQLTVTGTLVDGNQVNLTGTGRGTGYSSSDLSIANFGVEDGRVYGAEEGIATISISNGAHTANVQVTVVTFDPQAVSYIELTSQANNVAVEGVLAYVATQNGLSIVDISKAKEPIVLSELNITEAVDVKVKNGFAYVALDTGMAIVNVADASAPVLVNTFTDAGKVNDIALENNRVYLATHEKGLLILDISTGESPVLSSEILSGSISAVAAEGEFVTVISGDNVIAIGATIATSPNELSRITVAGAVEIALKDGFAFIAAGSDSNYATIDFNDPVNPVVNTSGTEFFPSDVVVNGDHALYTTSVFQNSVPIVNVKDPSNPLYQALIDMSEFGSDECVGIDADISYAYCTASNRLYISQYREIQDVSGIAPVITWQQPTLGDELYQNRPYRVSVAVEDDVRVAVVNFYANNELVHTDITSPYTFVYKVPDAIESLIFRVEALDLGDNLASTGDVVFAVNPLDALEENWNEVTVDYFSDDLLAASVVMEKAVYISDHKLATVGNLLITGAEGSSIIVDELEVGGNLIIDANTTLTIKTPNFIKITGNIILKQGAKLTIPDASGADYHRLDLDVAGKIQLLSDAMIDLNGKGFEGDYVAGPDGETGSDEENNWGCHGGIRNNKINPECGYGRYNHARFPGSSGDYYNTSNTAKGGGAMSIKATEIELLDNGSITVNGLNGGHYTGGGAGGAIHIEAERLTGSGLIQAKGGIAYSPSYPGKAGGGRISLYVADDSDFSGELSASNASNAGAGSIYIKKPSDTFGELIIDNKGAQSLAKLSVLQKVGRHSIVQIREVESNIWRIAVEGSPWKETSEEYDWGVDGYWVYLDAEDSTARRYQIKTNTDNQILIETTDDLSVFENKELVGVHVFDRLTVRNGAWLDTGEDRLQVLQISSSNITSDGTVSGEVLPLNIIQLALTQGGNIVTEQELTFFDFDIQGTGSSTITAPSLTVENDFNLEGIDADNRLTIELDLGSALNVAGNMSMDTATLTVPYSNTGDKRIHELDINVGGALSVSETSVIDVSGRGYEYNHVTFPDFVSDSEAAASHGGNRRHYSGNAYGRYEEARFAGAGGDAYSSKSLYGSGGGILNITASQITLDGLLAASGKTGYSISGAGGSIHIETDSITGAATGRMAANGGSSYYASPTYTRYSSGAGGRISIYSADHTQYLGETSASSGSTSIAGAGTIYWQNLLEHYGDLIIDNADLVAQEGSTPLRSVGRRAIIGAYQATPGIWKVEVSGTPWAATDKDLQYGVDGLKVDLDASEHGSILYTIISNTKSVLEIHTTDNLLNVVGNELVGVKTFKTLNVLAGASLDIGDDRLVVLDLAHSDVAQNASLLVGEITPELLSLIQTSGGSLKFNNALNVSSLDLNNLGAGKLYFNEKVSLERLDVTSGWVYFYGGLDVIGDLTVSNENTYVMALNLTANNITLTDAKMRSEFLSVNQNLTLNGVSALTTYSSNTDDKRLYQLDINVGGALSVSESSVIDVAGLGYKNNHITFPYFVSDSDETAGHGGNRRHYSGTSYGRYEEAKFAGAGGDSTGDYPGWGGGRLKIATNTLTLDGVLTANGRIGNYVGGAGGSIHIDADSISGAATGRMTVNGGSNYRRDATSTSYSSGAGGRISIYSTDNTQYFGEASASSGIKNIAGAGTIYWKNPLEQYGDLIIDNADLAAQEGSTPLKSVGRREIIGAYQATPGVWKVEVSGTPWLATDKNLQYGIDGLEVDLDASEQDSVLYTIISNSESVLEIHTTDDLFSVVGNELVGVKTFKTLNVLDGASLDIGDDRLVVLDLANSDVAQNASLLVGEITPELLSLIQTSGGSLKLSNVITVNSLNLNNLGTGKLYIKEKVSLDSLDVTSGWVYFDGGLEVIGDLNINNQNTYVTALNLTANNIFLNDGKLKTEFLSVAQNLSLNGSSEITTSESDTDTKRLYELDINIGGALSISESSIIDVTGLGYKNNNLTFPEFASNADTGASHGGNRRHYSSNTYGRYEASKFAGAGGDSEGWGGGILKISATTLSLDGLLAANGKDGYYTSGAGGSIHIKAGSISGAVSGRMTVNGGTSYRNSPTSTSYSSGAGGRISIYSADNTQYFGQTSASSGSTSIAGAGTVYWLSPLEQYGDLIIDNADLVAQEGSTPLRSVGRREIIGAYQATPGVWKVEVSGTPWVATDENLQYGVDGLEVDLDASEQGSILYTIISNSESALEIHTTDDLFSVVGNELVGVKTFKTINVLAGASLDIGDDRLVVLDLANSDVAHNASLLVGEIDQTLLSTLSASGGTFTIRYLKNMTSLTIDSLGESTLRFSEIMRLDSLTISSGQVYFDGGLVVEGEITLSNNAVLQTLELSANNLIINNGTLITENLLLAGDMTLGAGGIVTTPYASASTKRLYGLNMVVDGTVKVAVTARIDVDGKGYPGDYWSGPDFTSTTRKSCHGGNSVGVTDCAYGRYEYAMFAGSAGDYRNATTERGAGGGIISLNAGNLELDGSVTAVGDYSKYIAGAGGSIHLDLNSFSGSVTGVVKANGGNNNYINTNYYNGAGGRISIYVADHSSYLGQWQARSGTEKRISGAGTIYVHDTDYEFGKLIIDNGGAIAQENSTPIRAIGQHVILQVSQLSIDQWEVEVADSPWKATSKDYGWGIDGINVLLDISDESLPLYEVVSNTTNTFIVNTTDDLSSYIAKTLVGVHQFNTVTVANGAFVDWGGDLIKEYGEQQSKRDSDHDGLADIDEPIYSTDITNPDTDGDGLVDGLEVALGSDPLDPLSGDITGYIVGLYPATSEIDIDLEVDLASVNLQINALLEVNNQRFVVDVTDGQIFSTSYISSNPAIASVNSMGVITAASAGNISVDVSLDGISSSILISISDKQLRNWSDQSIVLTHDRTVAALLLNNSIVSGEDYSLTVDGDLNIEGLVDVSITAKSLNVNGDLIIDGVTVTIGLFERLNISGSLILKNNATLTVPYANLSAEYIYKLLIHAAAVNVEVGSLFDVSGKGYPSVNSSGRTWPAFDETVFYNDNSACHGGLRLSGDDCAYGNYKRARFAGSAGSKSGSTLGHGGGIIEIYTDALTLDGGVSANGLTGYYAGGAGGSVHIEATRLTGTGSINSNGANNSRAYSSGGNLSSSGTGGRISLLINDMTEFDGVYTAASGGYEISGAGTVYTQDPDEAYGNLYVSNAGQVAPDNSTPIRNVGRHIVTGVDQVESGKWIVEVEGSPWIASNLDLDLGMQGLEIDLSANETSDAVYMIEASTASTITIYTNDDLNGVLGNELVGVHTFNTIKVAGGAKVDFGDDRLVIIDSLASFIGDQSAIKAGELDEATLESFTQTQYQQGGLWADYFHNNNLTSFASAKVDKQIDMEWPTGAPAGVSYSHWSVRWQGQLNAPQDDGYTFSGITDHPLKVWIDGELVINQTSSGAFTSDLINLTAGSHEFLTEYTKNSTTRTASVSMAWSYTNVVEEIIPKDAFYYRRPGIGGQLILSQFENLQDAVFSDQTNQQVVFNQPILANSLEILAGEYVFNDGLIVSQGISISGDAKVTIRNGLTAATLVLNNNAQLSSDLINVDQLDLNDASSLAPLSVTTNTYTSLKITSPVINIATDAKIDASGMGYQGVNRGIGKTWPAFADTEFYSGNSGCHGGVRLSGDDCAYGDYQRARFAGSAGGKYAATLGHGGGVIEISTQMLSLDGGIYSNGLTGYYTGGAGGAVHIKATSLTGTGEISSNGASNSREYSNNGNLSSAGAGGRISLNIKDITEFDGVYTAASGGYEIAGAGTVYLKSPDVTHGDLYVSNTDQSAPLNSTPIRNVGRHTISGVDQVELGVWRIEIEGNPWVTSNLLLDIGLQGIEVDLSANESTDVLYLIETNTKNTITVYTSDDLSGFVGSELVGVHTFNTITVTGGAKVSFGDDRVVIHNPLASVIGHQSAVSAGEMDEATLEAFTQTEFQQGGLWSEYYHNNDLSNFAYSKLDSQVNFQWSNGAPASISYSHWSARWSGQIATPQDDSFTFSGTTDHPIKVWIDGQLVVEQSSAGTFTSEAIQLTSGQHEFMAEYSKNSSTRIAAVSLAWSYGNVVEQLIPEMAFYYRRTGIAGQLILSQFETLEDAVFNDQSNQQIVFNKPIQANSLEILAGDYLFSGGLIVSEGVKVSGDSKLVVSNGFTAATLELNDTSHFTVDNVTANKVDLNNASVLSALDSTTSSYTPLKITSPVINVASGARIDASGKGYLAVDSNSGRTWPSFVDTWFYSGASGCHGGQRRSGDKCSYGRFEHASFAGSAGSMNGVSYPGHGGGVIEIYTDSIRLDGDIKVGGLAGYYTGGAGGAVHIEADILTGGGNIRADGAKNDTNYSNGNNLSSAGAGGRISLHVKDIAAFSGEYGAASGGYQVAGAGTVYVKSPDSTHGDLYVSNADQSAPVGSTPIRSIGRHTISGVDEVELGVWRVEVEGQPWTNADVNLDIGLSGTKVDLEASELLGVHYEVETNTTNTITIYTNDNLSSILGNELVGVQTFNTLTVTGGANVDFGGDRLIVNDLINSSVDSSSQIHAGSMGQELVSKLLEGGGNIVFMEPVIFNSLSIENVTKGKLSAPSLIVNGDLTITDSQLELRLAEPVQVSGDMIMIASTLKAVATSVTEKEFYPMRLNVTGVLDVDANSILDASGKGYATYSSSEGYSWPNYEKNWFDVANSECHGGNRRGSTNCAYGRYDRATYTGSAGTTFNDRLTGYGGGIIEIYAGSLMLNGEIKSNGIGGYYGGGAGGSIHIETNLLIGSGQFYADGGLNYFSYNGSRLASAGAGGRISLYVKDSSTFDGGYRAASGSNDIAGAGTVFIQNPVEAYGSLIVDNAGNISETKSTPIRSVGRHYIIDVNEIESGIWKVEVEGSPWQATDAKSQSGINGIEIDLDASENSSALYMVEANTENTVTVHTSDDLISALGNELVGVHTFKTLIITGGAKVDFGDDHLKVLDIENSRTDSLSHIHAGSIDHAFVEHILRTGGKIEMTEPLTLNSLEITGVAAQLSVPSLTVNGDFSISNSQLVLGLTEPMNITGDMLMVNSSLSVPDANTQDETVFALELNVAGLLDIDGSSTLDVSGKGYSGDYSGPDFGQENKACSAGVRNDAVIDCTYGLYEHGKFAGSGGQTGYGYLGNGGGVINIIARQLNINGTIKADGLKGGFYGAAGGAIHVEVDVLKGDGALTADGGNMYTSWSSYSAGSGGRISVYTSDRLQFSGSYTAHSGSTYKIAGAGTVYFKDSAESHGHLTVNNGGYVANTNSTPIRSVGLHIISGVEELEVGVWRIAVNDTPWKATDTLLDWGINGIEVDLDATENASPLYEIQLNTLNDMIIHTLDDLSSVLGNQLVGVHTFKTLNISGGAKVTVGTDKVIILDQLNSSVSGLEASSVIGL
jgi:hypothetical protein